MASYRYRPYIKQTTSASHRLDIRWLRQRGYLIPGNRFNVSWASRGKEIGNIGVEMVSTDQVRLVYMVTDREGNKQNYNYPVPLTYTKCNYGGVRPWFRCLQCGKRVAVLYLGRTKFYCRTCQNLTYNSCQESGNYLDQLSARIVRLKRRLGDQNAGGLTSLPFRPKGMHHKTYLRIANQISQLEGTLLAAAGQKFNCSI